MTTEAVLDPEVWTAPTAMTALDDHADWTARLPTEPEALRALVPSLVINPFHPDLPRDVSDERRSTECQLRPAADLVAAVRHRAPDPSGPGPLAPADRVIGFCRHAAVLLVAFLRATGVPARARCGFASYLEPGRWANHWIAEWWDGERWRRADAEVDADRRASLAVDLDPDDLHPDHFLDAGTAWQRVRSGRIDPALCGVATFWGLGFVRGSVVRDLAALNKVELLECDLWGAPVDVEMGAIDPVRADELIDDVATATSTADDTERLCVLYGQRRLAVPPAIWSVTDTGPTRVTLDVDVTSGLATSPSRA